VTLANPQGAWALLGLLLVVAIHFFRQRSKRLSISTLFLFEQTPRLTGSGVRIQKFKNSISLWLQLLSVLALCWLLVEPMYFQEEATLRAIIVLDSSASMSAFRQNLNQGLARVLEEYERSVPRVEWTLLEISPGSAALYSGDDAEAFLSAVEKYNPGGGVHDIEEALKSARRSAGDGGVVIFATDHDENLPEGVGLLAVGAPLENVGFVDVRLKDDGKSANGLVEWRALIRNYSESEQTRTWSASVDGREGDSKSVVLGPNQISAISGNSGNLPAGAERIELNLSQDAFLLDDRLPLLRPSPKIVYVAPPSGEDGTGGEKLLKAFESFESVQFVQSVENADIASEPFFVESSSQKITHRPTVLFPRASGGGRLVGGVFTVENHPLMDGLSWRGLLCGELFAAPSFPSSPSFNAPLQVLLWRGSEPAISLTPAAPGQSVPSLVFHFSLEDSNIENLPEFIILLHRFTELVRTRKAAFEQANFETGQQLEVAPHASTSGASGGEGESGDASGVSSGAASGLDLKMKVDAGSSGSWETTLPSSGRFNAPQVPAFFTVNQGEQIILIGSTHFFFRLPRG